MSKERHAVWMTPQMQKDLFKAVPIDMSARDAVKFCITRTRKMNEIKKLILDHDLSAEDVFQQIVDIVL